MVEMKMMCWKKDPVTDTIMIVLCVYVPNIIYTIREKAGTTLQRPECEIMQCT